jgi:hypothetical protein
LQKIIAGKICKKKLFPKEMILKKKEKILGMGQKHEINYA